ncbi:MAG: hypothetical protein RLZZ253_2410 [Verrucomicrobiota bacterium]|jgi:signal transduction histidine kinase
MRVFPLPARRSFPYDMKMLFGCRGCFRRTVPARRPAAILAFFLALQLPAAGQSVKAPSIPFATDNVALRKPVKSSHPLYGTQKAASLTDGLAGAWAHPLDQTLGNAFYFEIDLGRVHPIEHIAFRNRGDNLFPNRMSQLLVRLYEDPPETGAEPVWVGQHRPDGTPVPPGALDVLRATAGKGIFQGRYLRISTAVPKNHAPQLAEVEVHPPLNISCATLRADGREVPIGTSIRVPSGSQKIELGFQLPPLFHEGSMLFRFRLGNPKSPWLLSSGQTVEIPTPNPGSHVLEAQVRHSDGIWDQSVFRIPVEIPVPLTEQAWFRLTTAFLLLAAGMGVARYFIQRRLIRRVENLERAEALDRERARIAKDMHDVVGARLAQLSVLHEIALSGEAVPAETRTRLESLTQLARRAVSELDEVVWAVNPANDNLQSFANYLCHAASEYLEPLGIHVRHVVPEEIPEEPVSSKARHELFLAAKEALQNIVKHSGADRVQISFGLSERALTLAISDNGRGLPSSTTGLEKDGLHNMQKRMTSVGGHFTARSEPGSGTTVEFSLPRTADLAG